jgi:hypothetical protein
MRTSWLLGKASALAALVAGSLFAAMAAPAGATVITAFPVDFSAAEGSLFNGAVATFTDDNPAAVPADFTATIDWGDGTATSPGMIFASSAAFAVVGQHTYADEGTFTATVTISDVPPGTGTATVTDTASVTESDSLSGTPVTFTALAGVSFTSTVANFTDSYTGNAPGDFTATIDWGDATTSAGTITGGGASYSVSGTHTYAGSGTFSVIVTLSDDAPGTATATVTSTAHVGGTGVMVFPAAVTPTEGVAFNGVVATFSDSRAGAAPADFTTSIDWGDGAVTAGIVTSNGGGTFSVSGMHTYADEGSPGINGLNVSVTDNVSGMSGSTKDLLVVAEGDKLTPGPVAFTPTAGVPFSGVVATFTDTDTANVPADFTATIDWGDGNITAGAVAGGSGTFTVSGTHTYGAGGPFIVKVTLTDDAPGTAAATATGTVNVAAAPIAAVPALDWRGMTALVLALAAAGLFLLRRT